MIKNLIKIFLIALLCTVTASPITNEDPEVVNHSNEVEVDGHKEEYRLPHETEPRLYVLEFDPDFEGEKFTFKGNGTILFEVLQPTTSVTLHRSNKIVIDPDSVAIVDEKGIFYHPVKQDWNSENDFYTIKFEKKLEPGNYTLKINWVSDDYENDWFSTDYGFFRAQEQLTNENSSYLIATLFQPISARTAFPCWDEPGFKAQFEISVKHSPNYTALSNMPEKNHQELDDGRVMTNFERSVKMSSYNLCIVVANCTSIKSTERNISFYGFYNLHDLEFSLKISESAVKVLEAYTDMPYSLPKLDQLTIPQLLDMPAMENWGLITYPTMSVRFKNTTLIPDVDQQDNVAFLVAHEVSHQWFGNLVTSAWWDDLWLSEAFATFFPHKIIDQLEGGKRAMDTFTIENINDAMDQELPPHRASAIKVEPKDKHGIIQMFGSATYYKGAGILQMLENVIGEDVFRHGIRRYLKAHKFGAVTSDDLWAAFQEAYDEVHKENSLNIKDFMDPWILQKGTPVLNVARNYETGETNITQTNSWDDLDAQWTIPINYATKSNPDFSSTLPTLWMNKNETTITLPSINKDDWIILNIQQRAMYQGNYDEENWNRLADYLIKDHEKIHPVNRAQLIATAIRNVKNNPSFIDTLFKISLYLNREKEFLPWVPLTEILAKISEEYLNTNNEDLFEEYIRFLTNAIAETNFEGETLESARIRKVFAPVLCGVKNKNCLSYAQKIFDQFLQNPSKNAFPEYGWDWVICTGLKDANDTVWEKFTSDEAPIKKSIQKINYKLIKCTNDNEKRDKYLMKIIHSNSTSRPYFVNRVILSFLGSNRNDVNYIMQFFCDHFEDFEKLNDGDYFESIIERIFSKVQNQEQLDKVRKYFFRKKIFNFLSGKLKLYLVLIRAIHLNRETDSFLIESDIDQEYGHRLPQSTAPRVYVIEFDPDFIGELFTFTGNSTIIFEVLEYTSSVILHRSDKITIDRNFTHLVDINGAAIKPEKQKWSPWNEFYKITFSQKLEPGNYSLKMKWSGIDATGSLYDFGFFRQGFFRAYDKIENDKHKYLVTTHFEPSGARSAFPCWDEPGFKAQFEISVKHFPNYTALSNMPEKSRQLLPDGRIITHFERSLKMSPYLPCVAVADYQAIKNQHGNITFYSLENNLDSLKFALEISEKVISIMEAYTGVPYALPKLDQIAISQYKGGMEHWGLVSYDTRMVKFENSTLIPNIEQKDRILFLVAHELAHQWFGNLVSPVWWDDTWLNEGFAAYFQSKIIDQIYPHWHIMDHFVIESVNHDSYDSESYLPQAKPIKWTPPGKIALRMVFNPVTYRKGAAVIHMLEHILTEEVFREGLQRYFKAHQFDSVVTNDLWRAFQEVYNKKHEDKPLDIKETMDPWIEQTGTPVVNVTRNYETGEITLIQKNSRNENPKNKWRIPINFATKSNPDFSRTTPTMWMEVDQEVTTIPDVKTDDWIIVNIQQRGFYQVNYDKENWKLIADYLNSEDYTKIHVVNRAQLFDDIHRLYSTDKSYLEILVNITSYLHQETDYLPWISAVDVIVEMQENMRNTLEEESFETYMLYLTNAVMDKLGFENREDDDHSAIRIRSILAPIVCSFGHAECKLFANRLLKKYLEDPSKNTIPSSDWEWIACNGLRTANESLRGQYMASDYEDFDKLSKLRILIECTKDFQLKEEYFSSLTSANSTADAEDIDKVFDILLGKKLDDVNFVLDYFIDHFKDLKKLYDEIEDDEYLIPISRIALAIRTQDQYEKFKNFVESIIVPDLKGKSDSQGSTLLLQTSLEESLNSINQSKLHSVKFHELMDKKFTEPNVIEIGTGLKN
ncbi:GSCOCG00009475001-RA-CDS [Cotesia congregata]|nr:GSCOCG00009475001-RA-CDS [Cotesia congregata]